MRLAAACEPRPKGVRLFDRLLERSVAVDDHIGYRESLRVAGLGAQPVKRFLASEPPQLHEPLYSGLGARVDDDDEVEPVITGIPRRLSEKRHVVDHHRIGIAIGQFGEQARTQLANGGMRDGVECEAGIGILEDHRAQRGAVERAICCDHTETEPFDDRCKTGSARCYDVTREFIRIHPRGSKFLETARNHCFS